MEIDDLFELLEIDVSITPLLSNTTSGAVPKVVLVVFKKHSRPQLKPSKKGKRGLKKAFKILFKRQVHLTESMLLEGLSAFDALSV